MCLVGLGIDLFGNPTQSRRGMALPCKSKGSGGRSRLFRCGRCSQSATVPNTSKNNHSTSCNEEASDDMLDFLICRNCICSTRARSSISKDSSGMSLYTTVDAISNGICFHGIDRGLRGQMTNHATNHDVGSLRPKGVLKEREVISKRGSDLFAHLSGQGIYLAKPA